MADAAIAGFDNSGTATPGDSAAIRGYAAKLRACARTLQAISDDAEHWLAFYSFDWQGQWKDDLWAKWCRYVTANRQLSARAWAQDKSSSAHASGASRATAFGQAIDGCNAMADWLERYAASIDQQEAQQTALALDVAIIGLSVAGSLLTAGLLTPVLGTVGAALVIGTVGGAVTSAAVDFTNQTVDNMILGHEGFLTSLEHLDLGELGLEALTGLVIGGISTLAGLGLGALLSRLPAGVGTFFANGLRNSLALRAGVGAVGFGLGTFMADVGMQVFDHQVDPARFRPLSWGQAGEDALISAGFGVLFEGILHPAHLPSDPNQVVVRIDTPQGRYDARVRGDGSLLVFQGENPVGSGRLVWTVAGEGPHPRLSLQISGPGANDLVETPLVNARVIVASRVAGFEVHADGQGQPWLLRDWGLSDGTLRLTVLRGGQASPPELAVGPDGGLTVPKGWAALHEPVAGKVTVWDPQDPDQRFTFDLEGTGPTPSPALQRPPVAVPNDSGDLGPWWVDKGQGGAWLVPEGVARVGPSSDAGLRVGPAGQGSVGPLAAGSGLGGRLTLPAEGPSPPGAGSSAGLSSAPVPPASGAAEPPIAPATLTARAPSPEAPGPLPSLARPPVDFASVPPPRAPGSVGSGPTHSLGSVAGPGVPSELPGPGAEPTASPSVASSSPPPGAASSAASGASPSPVGAEVAAPQGWPPAILAGVPAGSPEGMQPRGMASVGGPGVGRLGPQGQGREVELLGPGGARALEPGTLAPEEVAQAARILDLRGGHFQGPSVERAPGVDGAWNGELVSLKATHRGGLGGFARELGRAEESARRAGYSGVGVYVEAPNIGREELLDFGRQGVVPRILDRGIVRSVWVLTRDGWVVFPGRPDVVPGGPSEASGGPPAPARPSPVGPSGRGARLAGTSHPLPRAPIPRPEPGSKPLSPEEHVGGPLPPGAGTAPRAGRLRTTPLAAMGADEASRPLRSVPAPAGGNPDPRRSLDAAGRHPAPTPAGAEELGRPFEVSAGSSWPPGTLSSSAHPWRAPSEPRTGPLMETLDAARRAVDALHQAVTWGLDPEEVERRWVAAETAVGALEKAVDQARSDPAAGRLVTDLGAVARSSRELMEALRSGSGLTAWPLSEAELALARRAVAGFELLRSEARNARLVRFAGGGWGVWKPETGVNRLGAQEWRGAELWRRGPEGWEHVPEEEWRWVRELAAYRLDRMLGFGLVPTTVARAFEPEGVGALQEWVEGGPGLRYPELYRYPDLDRQRLAVLDYLIANSDRTAENLVTRPGGRPVAIDHGDAFPSQAREGRITSDFVAEMLLWRRSLAAEVWEAVRALDPSEVYRMLRVTGLGHEVAEGALARLREVRERGRIVGEAWPGAIVYSQGLVRRPRG